MAPGPHAGRRRQQAPGVVRRGPDAPAVGHLPRRALLRLRDPRLPGQVLLRVARRARRLPRLAQELVRPQRHDLRGDVGRPRHGALPLHRQGHRPLPLPLLARDAPRRRLPGAEQGVRPRLPHRERREDEQEPRDVRLRAHLPRPPRPRLPALLLRLQDQQHHRRHRPQPRRLRAARERRPRRQDHQPRLARRADARQEARRPPRRARRRGLRPPRGLARPRRRDRRALRGAQVLAGARRGLQARRRRQRVLRPPRAVEGDQGGSRVRAPRAHHGAQPLPPPRDLPRADPPGLREEGRRALRRGRLHVGEPRQDARERADRRVRVSRHARRPQGGRGDGRGEQAAGSAGGGARQICRTTARTIRQSPSGASRPRPTTNR